MIIYAMRHGENKYATFSTNQLIDTGLTENGMAQVVKAASEIKELGITHLFSSPAHRARQTADILCLQLNLQSKMLNSFKPVNFPSGINLAPAMELIKNQGIAWPQLWLEGFQGFEKPENFLNRVKLGLPDLKCPGTPMLVCHEETIWAFMHFFNDCSFADATKIAIDNASIHQFQF